jgi:catechol 2,3-dioxygenase-like lactoylglutathione lyase family enzyme
VTRVSIAVAELLVADPASAWGSAGFAVEDDVCRVGGVDLRLAGSTAGRGVVAWSLTGIGPDVGDVDGLPTRAAGGLPRRTPGEHPNGVAGIDHVVLLTPDLERTLAALTSIGLAPRRHRDGEMAGAPVRQVFYRLGEVILEVVGSPGAAGPGPARLWGITFTVADIDATAALLGDGVGPVKDAVQPGRRITTLRHKGYGMTVATAFISPVP